MLKAELQKELDKKTKELNKLKGIVKNVAEEALSEACADALPYVAQLDEDLDLGMTTDGYICLSINLPVWLQSRQVHEGIPYSDVKSVIDGKEIEVTSVDEVEKN